MLGVRRTVPTLSLDNAVPREYARYRVAAYADVMGEEHVHLYHRITNVSVGGMCFDGLATKSLGSTVDVMLNFPREEAQIPVTGEVVWVDGEGEDSEGAHVGLRWVDISESDRTKLAEYIASAMTGLEPDAAA